jgi:hypothetical protein
MTYADVAARPTYLWPAFKRGSVHSRNVSSPCACIWDTEVDPSLRATAIFFFFTLTSVSVRARGIDCCTY